VNNGVEAFLETAQRILRTAAKRRWLALGVAAGFALACSFAITEVADRYEAKARIYVDTQTVLKPLMAGLTFQPDIDQQVRMLAQTLISRPNVERLVRIPELQLDVSDSATREEVVTRLMDKIKVMPTSSGNLYEISYRGSDPDRSQRLVEAIVNLFVNSGADAKKRDSQDAGRFIDEQIRSYEKKLIEAENRLKEFKMRNFGVSGVSTQDYFTRVSTLTEVVSKLRAELNAAEMSRDSYRRELTAEDPQLPAVAAVVDVEARLDAQRKQLDDLLRRYTEAHPDVISARRIISQLEADAGNRREIAEHSPARPGKGRKAATSPVYQRLRISLAEAEAQVASLRSQLSTQQAQLDQVRALAGRAPQVEAELAQLNRDYDVIRKNYDLMVVRRESASLGVKLDESSQLAEFRLVEPPRVSSTPAFPSRVHLGLIAMVVSMIAGIVAALVADRVRPTIESAAALQAFTRRPMLGSVSVMLTSQALRQRRADVVRFAIAAATVLAMQSAWLAWIASNPIAR
jgi:polysaccharide chain length determinant protein (PEP-CTERM system associated)